MTTYVATCPRCHSELDAPGATETQSLLCGACNHVFDSTPPRRPHPVTRQEPILRREFRVPARVRWTILAVLWFGVFALGASQQKTAEEAASMMLLAALLPASIVLYFAPAIVAYRSDRRQKVAIAVLNLLLGWSVIGWVAAIVWACVKDRDDDRR